MKKTGPKFSSLSLATAAHLCPPRRGADSTSSHDIPPRGVPTPLRPLHPIPRCWPEGAQYPNSGNWAQETLWGNPVPDSGTCTRVRSCGKLVLRAPKSCCPSYLGTVAFQHRHYIGKTERETARSYLRSSPAPRCRAGGLVRCFYFLFSEWSCQRQSAWIHARPGL